MTHDEIQLILGAYALDAVEGDERQEVCAHLITCEPCRVEVRDSLEAAAMFAVVAGDNSSAVVPSDTLWHSIHQATISFPSAPIVPLGAARIPKARPSRVSSRFLKVAAGLLLVAVVASQFQVAHLNGRLNQLSSSAVSAKINDQLASALLAGNYQTVKMNGADGHLVSTLVLRSGQRSFFVNSRLSRATTHMTYQLWGQSNGKIVSLGLLGRNPHVVTFHLDHPVTAVMVNLEPQGGTSKPTTPVLAQAVVV